MGYAQNIANNEKAHRIWCNAVFSDMGRKKQGPVCNVGSEPLFANAIVVRHPNRGDAVAVLCHDRMTP